MKIKDWYFSMSAIGLFVGGFQWGRYDGYGTIFGYKTSRYYKIEASERKYLESKNKFT